MRRSDVRYLVGAVVVLGLVGCGPGERPPRSSPSDLWGWTFVSRSVIRDGQPQTLVADTRAEVSFDDGEDLLRWEAGCNFFGGTVDITADRLLVQEMSGTEMGCPEALESQDRWLTGFFESGPNWELEDERLTLTSGPTVMELKPTDN